MVSAVLAQAGLLSIFILTSAISTSMPEDSGGNKMTLRSSLKQKIIVIPTRSPNEESLPEIENLLEKNHHQQSRYKQRQTSSAVRRSRRFNTPTTTTKSSDNSINVSRGPILSLINKTKVYDQQNSDILNSTSAGRSFGYGGGGNYGASGYASASGGSGSGYNMYGGGANGANMMYFSNFDTALTTLAFLSFGVFLLNMIFSFLNMNNATTGTGTLPSPGTILSGRTERFLMNPSNATQREKRELLSAPILLALNAMQYEELSGTASNFDKNDSGSIFKIRNCHFLTFCSVQMDPLYRQQLNEIISDIIKRTENRKSEYDHNKIWLRQIRKFYQAKRILSSGLCSKIVEECSKMFDSNSTPPR